MPNIDKDILKPPTVRQPSDADDEHAASSSSIFITPGRPSRKNLVSMEVINDSTDRKDKGKAVVYTTDDEDQADESTPLLEEEHYEEVSHKPIGLRTFGIFRRKRPIPDRETRVRVPPTRAAGPVRVEPKVYFANERTFFSWLRFCVLLGTLALALFNAAAADDKLATYCAVGYTSISIGVLFYALFQYNRRNRMINSLHPGPYGKFFLFFSFPPFF